jgi:hypothetical protein
MRRLVIPAIVLAVASSAFSSHPAVRWPPWLSIESPVNPVNPDTRGAVLLVHASAREGAPAVRELSATAEGLVNGSRRSMPVRLDVTREAGVFALRKQWPADGTWLLAITFHRTTALVALDHDGNVASVRVPTEEQNGNAIPRAVPAREIDSTLAAAARR